MPRWPIWECLWLAICRVLWSLSAGLLLSPRFDQFKVGCVSGWYVWIGCRARLRSVLWAVQHGILLSVCVNKQHLRALPAGHLRLFVGSYYGGM